MVLRTDYGFMHISRRDDVTMFVKTFFSEGEDLSETELRVKHALEGLNLDDNDYAAMVFPVYSRHARVKRPLTDFKSADISLKRLVDADNAVEFVWNRHLTDAQLREEMNIVLAEDTTRTAIDEQKIR